MAALHKDYLVQNIKLDDVEFDETTAACRNSSAFEYLPQSKLSNSANVPTCFLV